MGQFDYNRRSALQLMIAAGLANLLADPALAAEQSLKHRKIIVIGAGISGLAAAQILRTKGAEVIVLEARNRTGGRISTDTSMGIPFELGAAWIHGPSRKNPLMDLVGENHRHRFVTDDGSISVYDRSGRKLSQKKLQRIERKWQKILHRIDEEYVEADHESLLEAIQYLDKGLLKDDGVRWALSAFTEFSTGGPISRLSAALHDDDSGFNGQDIILKNGMSHILKPLTGDLDIRTDMPVTEIKYRSEGVDVISGSEKFKADIALVTVPLGVLKSKSIKFTPYLPAEYEEAINNIGFGSVAKIALRFSTAFWPVNTQYFGIFTRPHGRWNLWLNYRTFSNENVLVGFSFGKYALSADRMNDGERLEHALEALRQVWGSRVGDPEATVSTRWSVDPYAMGAYSFPGINSRKADFRRFNRPLANRVFFAGEHTLFKYYASMHGALISGREAAKRIISTVN